MEKLKGITFMLMLVICALGCSEDDDVPCFDMDVAITSLEEVYGCVNTPYQMDVDLLDSYLIIRNESEFDTLVSGACMPDIDFEMYDLVIGKQGLASGFNSIAYNLQRLCVTNDFALTVVFVLNATAEAPNVTYHALIPKLEADEALEVIIEFI